MVNTGTENLVAFTGF